MHEKISRFLDFSLLLCNLRFISIIVFTILDLESCWHLSLCIPNSISLYFSLSIYIVRVSVLLYQRMFMSGLAVRQLERTADIPGDWYTCKI